MLSEVGSQSGSSVVWGGAGLLDSLKSCGLLSPSPSSSPELLEELMEDSRACTNDIKVLSRSCKMPILEVNVFDRNAASISG